MGENGDFQPLHPKISRNSQTVSNAATVTINHQLQICCRFLRGLHTRTAVVRLPLRQLGFLVPITYVQYAYVIPEGNVRSHLVRSGSLEGGHKTTVRSSKTSIFKAFGRYVFGTLVNEANVIM